MKSVRNSLVWELTTENQSHSSYIMGTMHVRDKRMFEIDVEFRELLEKIDLFLSEVNLDMLQSSPEVFNTQLPDNISLAALLGNKYQKVRTSLKKAFSIDIDHFNQQLPLVIVNLISESVLSQDHALSLDFHLWSLAKEKGVITDGVESLEEHAETLKSIPLEAQVSMLVKIARNVSLFRNKIIVLAQLYQERKIHKLYKISIKDLGSHKQTLLFNRNVKMAQRLLNHHENQSTFLAVGAGHLSGEKGVLHLLNQIGGRVRPVI